MQIKRIIGGAAAITAVTALAGAAYTAGNPLPDDGVAGYGSAVVSGVTVTNIAYNVDGADRSLLNDIVFTTVDAEAIGAVGELTINSSTATPIPCTRDETGVPTVTFTCNTGDIAIDTVTSTGFTVTRDATVDAD